MSAQADHYILTLSCPDTTGIVHRVTGVLFDLGCNILDAQQFGDADSGRFFLRVHFTLPEGVTAATLRQRFGELAGPFAMDWHIHDVRQRARLLLMVSKQGHCLNDLLFRTRSGQLPVDIVGIVSNHDTFAELSRSYGVPFHHLPVTPESKAEQEHKVLQLVDELEVDLVVLARYMQILSADMCRALEGRAINIHHSFLPSFKGARPYHQAHDRGVKLIGATAHYVTPDLDEGPIIAQGVERVDHTMTAEALAQVGSDIESQVLARAVRSHVEHRVMLNAHRTVVFR